MAVRIPEPPLRLRQFLLALLAFGLIGLGIELVLLEHHEELSMLVPFAALTVGLVAVTMHAVSGTARTARVLRVAMILLMLAGATGIVLHFRGGLEFQLEMNATLPRWTLFWKVMHMKAPPILAPGVMVQLGLVGLISTYRQPA